jgi:hypothetical protein
MKTADPAQRRLRSVVPAWRGRVHRRAQGLLAGIMQGLAGRRLQQLAASIRQADRTPLQHAFKFDIELYIV